jgi:microcystin-dependent protein
MMRLLRYSCLLILLGSAVSAAPAFAQDPFIGEIRLVGFTYCPRGWANADGQLLPIAQNQALFSLLGTTYGGDGVTTFSLPDLRGRAPIHLGQGPGLSTYQQGETGGAEQVTLTVNEMPPHTHSFTELTNANGSEEGIVIRSGGGDQPVTTTSVGGGLPHENRSPYLTMRYCVALEGIFPSRE